jgi:DNA-binding LacI/PurR family transcriptional regulator
MEQFSEMSLQAVAEQGCRSVGLICPMPSTVTNSDNSRHENVSFYGHFMDRARDLGLEVRNEWMRITHDEADPRGQAGMQERFGCEEFLELWNLPARPEGLLVYPDTTVRGVILGLEKRQVRVPEELKLVLHKNEAIDLLCLMPATFVISSERLYAQALIEQVQKQFRGESCEPISVPFRLEINLPAN